MCAEMIERHPRIVRLPDAFDYMQALTFETLPGEPLITRDNLDSMSLDAILSGPLAVELNLEPVAIEAVAPAYLNSASLRSRFGAFRATAGR